MGSKGEEVRWCRACEDVESAQRANTPSKNVPVDMAACENGSPHTSRPTRRDRVLRREGSFGIGSGQHVQVFT